MHTCAHTHTDTWMPGITGEPGEFPLSYIPLTVILHLSLPAGCILAVGWVEVRGGPSGAQPDSGGGQFTCQRLGGNGSSSAGYNAGNSFIERLPH